MKNAWNVGLAELLANILIGNTLKAVKVLFLKSHKPYATRLEEGEKYERRIQSKLPQMV